jgi:hypothetical protein
VNPRHTSKCWYHIDRCDNASFLARETALKIHRGDNSEYDDRFIRDLKESGDETGVSNPLMITVPKLLTDPLTTWVERPKKNRNQVLGSQSALSNWYRLNIMFLTPV